MYVETILNLVVINVSSFLVKGYYSLSLFFLFISVVNKQVLGLVLSIVQHSQA